MNILSKIDNLFPYRFSPHGLYCKYWKHRKAWLIKPRYNCHKGWMDKVDLVPDLIFTALDNFVQEEADAVDWEASGHTVEVNGEQINVGKEMKDVLVWWHHNYHILYERETERLWNIIEKCEMRIEWKPSADNPHFSHANFLWDSEEKEKLYKETMSQLNALDAKMAKELNEYLHRVINLIPYMWT